MVFCAMNSRSIILSPPDGVMILSFAIPHRGLKLPLSFPVPFLSYLTLQLSPAPFAIILLARVQPLVRRCASEHSLYVQELHVRLVLLYEHEVLVALRLSF